jgi:hypothetical protein
MTSIICLLVSASSLSMAFGDGERLTILNRLLLGVSMFMVKRLLTNKSNIKFPKYRKTINFYCCLKVFIVYNWYI